MLDASSTRGRRSTVRARDEYLSLRGWGALRLDGSAPSSRLRRARIGAFNGSAAEVRKNDVAHKDLVS